MTFVLLMAGREIRASWRRLLFFFVCVAIGVGAIVALRSMIQNIRTGLSREARALIAGDVVIGTNRSWTPELRAAIERAARQRTDRRSAGRGRGRDRWSGPRKARGRRPRKWWSSAACSPDFRSTAPSSSRAALASRTTCSPNHGALVRPELLAQLGLQVGDRLIVGGVPFTIRGVISQEPGRRVGAFSFGSRVLVDYDDLMRTGLLSFGSRANYQILLKMTGDPQPLVRDLRQQFRDEFVNVRSYRSTEDQIGDDLATRRKLPEPGRLRDPGAWRDWRLERDARVRAPEDQERGDPQVRRRHDTSGPRRLRPAGRYCSGLAGSALGVAARATRRLRPFRLGSGRRSARRSTG